MKKTILLSAVFLMFQLFIERNAFTHPHVFISQKITIVFDDKGTAGFRMQWEFDDMFTSMILDDYDTNRNKKLEKTEIAVIKEKAFSYLANSDYFTFVRIDNHPFKVKFVRDFTARIENHKLIYDFFIPCHVSAAKAPKHMIVATYDPTYYSALFFAEKNGVTLDKKTGYDGLFDVKIIVKEDKSTKIYFDMINPMALFLDFKLAE